jgi:hypothetical protein
MAISLIDSGARSGARKLSRNLSDPKDVAARPHRNNEVNRPFFPARFLIFGL